MKSVRIGMGCPGNRKKIVTGIERHQGWGLGWDRNGHWEKRLVIMMDGNGDQE